MLFFFCVIGVRIRKKVVRVKVVILGGIRPIIRFAGYVEVKKKLTKIFLRLR